MTDVSPRCAAAADNYNRVSSVVFPAPRRHNRWEDVEDEEDFDWDEDEWHHGHHHDGGGLVVVILALAATGVCCCVRRRRRKRLERLLALQGRPGGPPPQRPQAGVASPPTRASAAEAEDASLLTPQAPVVGRPATLVAQPPQGVVMGTPVFPTYTDYERN